jgi:predicted ATPase with chaperone activity
MRTPRAPTTLAETGLSPEMVIDLILKTLYVQGARTGQQLTEALCLPFTIADEQLLWLQERRFIEVRRTAGPSRGAYVFDLSGPGRERAKEALESSQYVGAAPVPLAGYRTWVAAQSVRHLHSNRQRIRNAFSHLVLTDDILEALGPAIYSASSLFLYGDPGNGKTVIAEAIANILGGDIYIPRTVDIDGQIMALYDPVHHEAVVDEAAPEGELSWFREAQDFDRRFIRVRRPVVFVGGELNLAQLDLQYDSYTKMYQAPFQLKAAGGLLIIDDFGRQLVEPRDLLNRWIVPLEKRIDYLTLHTGIKFPVPFDALIIFATNLNPDDLVDEAFLRRIQYKLNVPDPHPEQYREIFRRVCAGHEIPFEDAAVNLIYDEYYEDKGIAARACHPRDILQHLLHIARFEERVAVLSEDMLRRACNSYFLIMARTAMEA